MHPKPMHIMTTLTVVFMLGCAVSAHPLSEPDLIQLLHVVNDHTVPCEERAAAERELIESSHDISMLPAVFSNLADPIFSTLAGGEVPIEAAYVGYSGTGSAETDCIYLPAHAQIAYARFRIWRAFAVNGEPKEERMGVYADLFAEAMTTIQLRHYIAESRRNWTPEIREHVQSICHDLEQPATVRYLAANTLLDMHHATPLFEHREITETIIATAWAERGNEFALRMGQRLRARDPRVAALKLDLYDHERSANLQRVPLVNLADMMDIHFGNVTGLYRDRRSHDMHREEIKLRDKRMALREQARETGDDTKLREFEAEIEAQRQAELEQRIELIDAWIAENRDRLEAEATAYAEAREQQHNAGQPQD